MRRYCSILREFYRVPCDFSSFRLPIFGLVIALTVIATAISSATANDWPSYRNGKARLGATDEIVVGELRRSWVYQAPAAPRGAWSSAEGRVIESKLIRNRAKYDDSLSPVVVGGRIYVGSSVDHHLHCLDSISGKTQWTFATGGPIRLAPTVDDGRVYFGSDDGHVYCLDALQGDLIWKHRAGPADEWLLARGEMISRWPVRTGVLVDQGIAYYGAGIFPHEDVFLYAVDAITGKVIWQQDNISALDAGRNDLSPQGYLLASDNFLFVPSGRSLPAVFDRKTGDFLYKRTYSWRTTAGGVIGGVQALVADQQLYASGPHHWLALDEKNGDVGFGWFAGRQLIVQGDAAYATTGSHLLRMDRLEYAINSRRRQELEMIVYGLKGKKGKKDAEKAANATALKDAETEIEDIVMKGIRWKTPTEDDAAILATGNLVFVGGENRITAYDIQDGHKVWSSEVDGQARGLVFADGQLLASTTSGRIECFSTTPDSDQEEVRATLTAGGNQPFGDDQWTQVYADAAERILKESGVNRGFCLVIGNGEGRLAWELARRSDLDIYAIDSDPEKVRISREMLLSTGLYGHRIVVHQAKADETFYSNFFANLIVSDSLVKNGQLPEGSGKVARHLKPQGGVMMLGTSEIAPDAVVAIATRGEIADRWLAESEISDQVSKTTTPHWSRVERAALPGSGNWSHQYGNPANTAVSNDTRIKGGLGVLWYGDPGPNEMVNRHEGAVGPLAVEGKLIVQGESSILAYDAYNGLFLWRHENPEAIRTGVFQNQNPANIAASDRHVFHFVGDQCLQLDLKTGQTLAIHRLPESLDNAKYQWGYLAVQDGILFGAATVKTELEERLKRRGRKTEDATDQLFAIDIETGKHLWAYEGQHISHHTIAIGPDEVFFVDSSISSERRDEILREDKAGLSALSGKERELAEERAKNADIRRTVALDSRTGELKWAEAVDVTDCSDIGIGGGKLTLMYKDGVLLLCGANANGHYWKQFIDGEFTRRRMVALQAKDGYKLWDRDANYKNRPIILGSKILAEPWIYDLNSGSQMSQTHPVTQEEVPWSLMRTGHHCGMFTGCDSGMLLFRSGDTAFYDLESESGTRHFAGHRMGCWINAIPAGGLVMIPEASAGCVCLYSIASTIVMEPREPRREWSIHSASGSLLPVQQMYVNLGGPGDRKDSEGRLWLAFPRPRPYKETSIDIAVAIDAQFVEGGKYWSERELPLGDLEQPQAPRWLYSSGAQGLTKVIIPLRGQSDGQSSYRVKLHFAVSDRDKESADAFVKFNSPTHSTELVFATPHDGTADQPSQAFAIITTHLDIDRDLEFEMPQSNPLGRLCAIEIFAAEKLSVK